MAEKVLLVDDEPGVLQVLAHALTRAGMSPVMASSGEEALELATVTKFDAAVVDKNMGSMDGVEVLRHLRRRQPLCACLLMTGMPSAASAIEALRLGVHDYLAKPSPELDQLGERVRAAIRKVSTGSEADQVCRLQELITRTKLELAMASELADSRGEEKADQPGLAHAERGRKLARSVKELLEKAHAEKGGRELLDELEAHLALLKEYIS